MTALKTADIDKFIAKPNLPVVLVYGPDAGLVRERVEALIAASVDDPNDAFAVARLDSEVIGANPGRLADEANTVPMFGGRRAVLLKVNSRHNIVPSVEAVLNDPPRECRVIIEAGELRKNAPLRAVCERAKSAAAIPCYVDNAQALAQLINQEMKDAALTLADDARTALMSLLGGDRLASRSEIRKLTTYAAGRNRIELADVTAVVSDASEIALDALLDATFAGKTADVEREFNKASGEGSSAASIVSAALRHVAQLHRMRLMIDKGDSAEFAMMRGAPPVHFSRKTAVETALRQWSAPRLTRAMGQLADASFEARKQATLGPAIAQRALLSLSVSARRREG
ncbi:MAG TPA: DNA polymerase III subunit delta [Pseudolabrys sp.]|nr:DNA polymerase III subunit delta [Pseudolabrys sp.]